jgi:hypothetical protein
VVGSAGSRRLEEGQAAQGRRVNEGRDVHDVAGVDAFLLERERDGVGDDVLEWDALPLVEEAEEHGDVFGWSGDREAERGREVEEEAQNGRRLEDGVGESDRLVG